MAKNPEQSLPMPEFDKGELKAELLLSTIKGSSGLTSCANMQYRHPSGAISFMMCGDFRSYLGRVRLPATQKNLDTLHAQNFTPEAIEGLKAAARDFYAKQAAND